MKLTSKLSGEEIERDAVGFGDASLMDDGRDPADDGRQHHRRGRHTRAVPPDELSHAVAEGVLPRRHRSPGKIPPDVLRQLLGREVAPGWVLPERLQDDCVQVASQVGRLDERSRGTGAAHDAAHGRAGRRRLGVAHGPHHVLQRLCTDLQGQLAGQKLVRDDAQGVHVAGGRQRQTPHLLRAGVVRRHGRQQGRGGRLREIDGLEQCGDTEVEELRLAVSRHEDVRRLEVPVHDQVLVGVVDRPAHGPEQLQTLPDAEGMAGAEDVDRLPFDVLHDQIRPALLGLATVEDGRDVGMLEPGQDVTLAAETPEPFGSGIAVHDLERHGLVEDVVVARCPEDDAHSAVTDLALHAIGADPPALQIAIGRRERGQ